MPDGNSYMDLPEWFSMIGVPLASSMSYPRMYPCSSKSIRRRAESITHIFTVPSLSLATSTAPYPKVTISRMRVRMNCLRVWSSFGLWSMRLTALAWFLGTGLEASTFRTSILTPPAKSRMAFTEAAAVGVRSTTSLIRGLEIKPVASCATCSGYGWPHSGETPRAKPLTVPRAAVDSLLGLTAEEASVLRALVSRFGMYYRLFGVLCIQVGKRIVIIGNLGIFRVFGHNRVEILNSAEEKACEVGSGG